MNQNYNKNLSVRQNRLLEKLNKVQARSTATAQITFTAQTGANNPFDGGDVG